MKNKRGVVLGIALILLALVTGFVFAGGNYATFQIINADTFEVISEGKLQAGSATHSISTEVVKTSVRKQLGFPAYSDTRTVGGVTQRIVWVSVGFED